MNIDYNKPVMSCFTKQPLDNNTMRAEQWVLKSTPEACSVWHHDGNQFIADYKNINKHVVVVGTELQCYHKFTEMFKNYAWQIQDSYLGDLKQDYVDAYEENGNEPVIINVI